MTPFLLIEKPYHLTKAFIILLLLFDKVTNALSNNVHVEEKSLSNSIFSKISCQTAFEYPNNQQFGLRNVISRG